MFATAPGSLSVLAIGSEHGVHPSVLASAEPVHTRIVGVIHEVSNWIEPGLIAARVPIYRTTESCRLLCGSVRDSVPLAIASTLEGVIETHPVSHLMGSRVAKVVWRCRSSWQ